MEELTYDELNNYLLSIFTGESIIKVNKKDEDVFLLLKQPSNRIKMEAAVVYASSYANAVNDGLLPKDELEELINKRGIFTEKDQKEVNDLKSKLEAQQVLLSKTTKVKANSDRIKNIILNIKNKINEIQYKKYSRLIMSAETKAEEDKNIFLCHRCVYVLDEDSLYWKDKLAFGSEKDVVFKNSVFSEFLSFYSGLSQELVRYIARSNLWRIRYISSIKCSESLFGVPTSDYSNDQFNLVYWSNYYQNIYEMMPEDRPSDMVIDDDEALDSYMTVYYKERTQDDASRRSKRSIGGKMSAFDKEEVIITRSNELYEDIKYDKPREAQRIKDRTVIKKRTKRR